MSVARRAGRCIACVAALAVVVGDLEAAAAGARASGPATATPAAPSRDDAAAVPDAMAPDDAAPAPVDALPIPDAPPEPAAAEPSTEPDASAPIEGDPGDEEGQDGDDAADADEISIDIDLAYDEVHDSPEGQVATRRIRGGIMLLSAGGVLGIGAIILGATDPCERLAGNSCMKSARNRGALTMGIAGLAIVGAGATLLALGLRARRRIAAGVQADRRSAGLVISGRF